MLYIVCWYVGIPIYISDPEQEQDIWATLTRSVLDNSTLKKLGPRTIRRRDNGGRHDNSELLYLNFNESQRWKHF